MRVNKKEKQHELKCRTGRPAVTCTEENHSRKTQKGSAYFLAKPLKKKMPAAPMHRADGKTGFLGEADAAAYFQGRQSESGQRQQSRGQKAREKKDQKANRRCFRVVSRRSRADSAFPEKQTKTGCKPTVLWYRELFVKSV